MASCAPTATAAIAKPFDDPVRERLQDHAVHEGTGVAFVAVADDVLDGLGLLAHQAPFLSGGETRAAAATQPGCLDGLDDLLWGESSALGGFWSDLV